MLFEKHLYLCKELSNFMLRDQRPGAYGYCPVCHSIILSETFILLITFEQLSASDMIFQMSISIVSGPFRGYQHFLQCDLDLGV